MPDNPARDSYDKETVSVLAGAENGAHTEDLANIAQRMLSYAGTPATGNRLFLELCFLCTSRSRG